jgi:DNA-binding MltR family transcriptional regulator
VIAVVKLKDQIWFSEPYGIMDILEARDSVTSPEEMRKLFNEELEDRGNEVLSKVAASLGHESDRGCVIFGAALLNESLEQLLRASFRRAPEDVKLIDSLFEGYAPLSTFSAKLQLAYALGILPRHLREKIELVRRIRNEFAHESGPLSFDDSRCADRLKLLFGQMLEDRSFEKMLDSQEELQSSDGKIKTREKTRRGLFITILTYILGSVHALAIQCKQRLKQS